MPIPPVSILGMKLTRESAIRARELHEAAIVIDCHCDILMPISDGFVRLGTQVDLPDPAMWTPPFEMAGGGSEWNLWPRGSNFGTIGQYSIPQFHSGGLTVQVCALFVEDDQLNNALEKTMNMIWWMHREVEENDSFELITTVEDVLRVKREGKCGGILALEGFEPLGCDVKLLDIFYKLGVRMGGLAHNRRNYFSDGTQYHIKTGGLTEMGKNSIRKMNELGMVVDVGHLNQAGFWEALETTDAPVVLSHRSPKNYFPIKAEESSFYQIYDVSRGRERLEAFAENGGVFGVFFLGAEDVSAVVSDIEYVIDIIGPDHVGLGSDLYGVHKAPNGLEDISKIPSITRALVQRGHSDEVILKILGGNFMRVFADVWN